MAMPIATEMPNSSPTVPYKLIWSKAFLYLGGVFRGAGNNHPSTKVHRSIIRVFLSCLSVIRFHDLFGKEQLYEVAPPVS
jgi:hypothetical protein